MTSVTDRVIARATVLAGKPANPASELQADLGLDSLDCVQLAMDLEEEFSVEIPDADVDNPRLATIGGLVEYIEGRIAP